MTSLLKNNEEFTSAVTFSLKNVEESPALDAAFSDQPLALAPAPDWGHSPTLTDKGGWSLEPWVEPPLWQARHTNEAHTWVPPSGRRTQTAALNQISCPAGLKNCFSNHQQEVGSTPSG